MKSIGETILEFINDGDIACSGDCPDYIICADKRLYCMDLLRSILVEKKPKLIRHDSAKKEKYNTGVWNNIGVWIDQGT